MEKPSNLILTHLKISYFSYYTYSVIYAYGIFYVLGKQTPVFLSPFTDPSRQLALSLMWPDPAGLLHPAQTWTCSTTNPWLAPGWPVTFNLIGSCVPRLPLSLWAAQLGGWTLQLHHDMEKGERKRRVKAVKSVIIEREIMIFFVHKDLISYLAAYTVSVCEAECRETETRLVCEGTTLFFVVVRDAL